MKNRILAMTSGAIISALVVFGLSCTTVGPTEPTARAALGAESLSTMFDEGSNAPDLSRYERIRLQRDLMREGREQSPTQKKRQVKPTPVTPDDNPNAPGLSRYERIRLQRDLIRERRQRTRP